MIENRLDKAFGPVGNFAGSVMILAGIGTLVISWTGLLFLLLGAFMAFTSTSVSIDLDNKRVKFSNNIFGLFSFGRWIDIEPSMKIGVKKSRRVSRTYSMSNRTHNIKCDDYRIILLDSESHPIMQLKKIHSLDEAKNSAMILSEKLGIIFNSAQLRL